MPQSCLLKPTIHRPDPLLALPNIAQFLFQHKAEKKTADLAVIWIHMLPRTLGVKARSALEIEFGSIVIRTFGLRRWLVVGAND